MDYGRSVLLMTAEQSHGVTGGEPDVSPRGGIFGPHGGGGGIYDGTNALNGVEGLGLGQAGLGWYFAAETPRPTQLAPNPAEGARGVGLGTAGLGVIPANCWGVPAFEDCKAMRWELARKECDPAYGGKAQGWPSVAACIDDLATVYAEAECVRFCPSAGATKSGGSWSYTKGSPCGAKSTIQFVQAWLDVNPDGIWGSKSQAALTSSGHKYTDIAEGCTGAVPGTGGGGYTPPPAKKDVPVTPVVAHTGGNMNALWIALGVAALGAGAFLLAKKKPMRANRRRRAA